MDAWISNDYYTILGVPKNADTDTIKKAYRGLARAHHPDLGGSGAKFKEIVEAYKVLNDPDTREQYDTVRTLSGGDPSHTSNAAFVDLFKEAFLEGFHEGVELWKKGKLNDKRGHDITTSLIINEKDITTSEELIKTITLVYNSGCIHCIKGCDNCEEGWVTEEKTVNVRIPPTVKNGERLKIAKAGGSGTEQNGDLYIKITIKPSLEEPAQAEKSSAQTQTNAPLSPPEPPMRGTSAEPATNESETQPEPKLAPPLTTPQFPTRNPSRFSEAPIKKPRGVNTGEGMSQNSTHNDVEPDHTQPPEESLNVATSHISQGNISTDSEHVTVSAEKRNEHLTQDNVSKSEPEGVEEFRVKSPPKPKNLRTAQPHLERDTHQMNEKREESSLGGEEKNETESVQGAPSHRKMTPPPVVTPPPHRTRRTPTENDKNIEERSVVHLNITQTELGKPVKVTSPRGEELSFVVPKKVKNGQVLRVKGKGVVNPHTLLVEDLLIHVEVQP